MSNHSKTCACILLFLISCTTLRLYAQQPLTVGQPMPDVEIRDLVNYKTNSTRISDFKGKLLILDFWGTYCAPCVAMFPRADSLEKQFKGDVTFLPVTNETRDKVVDFFQRMYNAKHLNPVSVVADSALSRLFYFSGVPYYIWIKDGKIIATSGPEEITARNISVALAGASLPFINRTDSRMRVLEYQKSIFVLSDHFKLVDTTSAREEIPATDMLSYSVATRYMEYARGRSLFNGDRFAAVNCSVDYLYRLYYCLAYYAQPVQGAFDSDSKHLFMIGDTSIKNRVVPPSWIRGGSAEDQDWMKANTVCYEIVYPKGLSWKGKMALLKQDLDRYFSGPIGFDTHVEQRADSNIYVLRRVDTTAALPVSAVRPAERHDRYSYQQLNLPLSHFVGLLSAYFFQDSKLSFEDKTMLTKPIDLQLNCDMTKIDAINGELRKYGLQFIREPGLADILVFTNNTKKQ